MKPSLEMLEDRAQPSALGAMLPTLIGNIQYSHAELQSDLSAMQGNYAAGVAAVGRGDTSAAVASFYGASWWHGRAEGDFCNGQKAVQLDRFLILGGAVSGQFDSGDGANVFGAWNTVTSLNDANDGLWDQVSSLWVQKFPNGYLYGGVAGADSLANVVPGL